MGERGMGRITCGQLLDVHKLSAVDRRTLELIDE
jgi:hypothetical protein